MATRVLARSLLTTNRTLSSLLSRSYASLSPSSVSTCSLLRLRPLVAVAANIRNLSPPATSIRGFATRTTSSSLNDSNPNWSNRPPKETILLDGCDFEHWLVVMEPPETDITRDEIIDSYIKTLAMVVGSEEEARMKIYSVSTRCYWAFGALVSEELSYKIKELPRVRWVLPDSYLDVKNKDYGGEPFINGQAVPYDPKYHEEWVRNNARANERNRRNDRPRNFDRSRNFERRRENMQNNRGSFSGPQPGGPGAPPPNNMAGPPPPGNMAGVQQGGVGGPPQGNFGAPPQGNFGGPPQGNFGGRNFGGPPQGNFGGPPQGNIGGPPQGNMGGPPQGNFGGPPQGNFGGPPQGNFGGPPQGNMGGPPQGNMGGPPQGNMGGPPQGNMGYNGGAPPSYQSGYGQPHNRPNQPGPVPNRGYQNNSSGQNVGGGNPYQTQDMPERDVPPPNYQ